MFFSATISRCNVAALKKLFYTIYKVIISRIVEFVTFSPFLKESPCNYNLKLTRQIKRFLSVISITRANP